MTLALVLGLTSAAQAATVNLAWSANTETDLAGYVVSYGTQANNYTNTVDVGNNTSKQLTNLVNGTRYYIVLKAYNTSGMYSGASQEVSGIASDTIVTGPAPSVPAGPSPVVGAIGVPVTAILSWAVSTNATQYDVAFGTTNPPAIVSSNQTSTTYQPAALTAGTTYYWQIVARGAGGSTSGPIWSLTAAGVAARPTPVAAYAFNEGSGTTTADATGNGRTGVLNNATWTSAGKNGGALSFNGSSARVTVADAPALRFSAAMTLEAWINPGVTTSPYWQAVVYKGPDNYVLAMPGSTPAPVAGGTIGSGLPLVNAPTTLPINTWSHVAVTYDGALLRLFVNGTQVATQAATGPIAVSTEPLEIGSSLVDAGFFVGSLDDVRVYNTALTLAQIQTDMATPVSNTVDTQVPTTPTTLTVTALSTTQLALTWTAATDNVGVTNYLIERCAGAGCTTFSPVGTASTTSFTDNGLAASTSYSYRVRATDAAGNLSGYSLTCSANTLTPIPAPTAPTGATPASSATGVSLSPTLSWTSTNATQYSVAFGSANPPAVVSSSQTSTTYQPAVLSAGTTYYWQIVAKSAGGSTSGPVWSFTTLPLPSAPTSPTPASAATNVSMTPALSWAASANATQYDVAFGATNPPSVVSSNQTSTSYQPAALTAGKTYYWQVVAKGAAGTASGPIWSFTALPLPSAPASPTPVSSAIGVSMTPTLSWAVSSNATQYDVAFGTANPPSVVSSNQNSTTYKPTALTAGKTYYWQVVAKGGAGSTSGAVWSFTTLAVPTAPASPSPAIGATGVPVATVLGWAASTNATQYDVAVGTTNPPSVVSSNQTATTYQPAALTAGATYYWQVIAKGPGGSANGAVWSFTTLAAPAVPASPTPVSGATAVPVTTPLSWTASANATQYDVAFGTTNPPAIVVSNQTSTTYQPAALVAGATYYWQIVAKGAGGSKSGPIWSFTTAAAARPTPVAAYAFNEGSGTTTADATGNGRTGVLTNATWTSAGKNGGALSFNGSSARVTVADAPALRFSAAMTLEAWINPAATTSPYWQAVIYKGPDDYVLAMPGSTPAPVAGGTIGSGLPLANAPNALAFNTWSHVAVTYDGALLRLFVNGAQVATQAATGPIAVSTEPLEIGSSLVDAGFFIGSLDDVRVYNTALTLAQIQTDMATPVTSTTQSAAPTAPSGPLPSNGATSVLTTVALNWTASTNAVQYDVAFGTTNPPPTVATNLTTTFYQPAAAFGFGTTYFWRVTAKGAGGTTSGPVWSFTAQPAGAAGQTTTSSSTSSQAQLLRLMTWNINGGSSLDGTPNVDAQVAVMVNSGAQIVALQGVTISTVGDLSALYKSKLENATSRTWNTLWIPDPRLASAGPEGNLFLTTLPIVGSAATELDSAPTNPSLLDAKRSAGWIGVLFNNVTVHVATTQLAVDATQRAAQMAQLGAWIANVPKPRLIGGDFNMLPGDATYQQMSNGFRDAWTAIAPAGNPGITLSAPSSQVGRVDYWWSELTDQHATPSVIKVVETPSSTHFAVVIDVSVQ